MADECKKTYKVVLLGCSGVGKTEIILRFVKNIYIDNVMGTTGGFVDFREMNFDEFQGKSIKFEIWDTPGAEKYHATTKIFYKDVDAVILVYDLTLKFSFEEIKEYWYPQIKEYAPTNISK